MVILYLSFYLIKKRTDKYKIKIYIKIIRTDNPIHIQLAHYSLDPLQLAYRPNRSTDKAISIALHTALHTWTKGTPM